MQDRVIWGLSRIGIIRVFETHETLIDFSHTYLLLTEKFFVQQLIISNYHDSSQLKVCGAEIKSTSITRMGY
jgi:hypothetical protein